MFEHNVLPENRVRCARCGETVPRGHTVRRNAPGRVCWYCREERQPIRHGKGQDLEDFDDENWDNWDD